MIQLCLKESSIAFMIENIAWSLGAPFVEIMVGPVIWNVPMREWIIDIEVNFLFVSF